MRTTDNALNAEPRMPSQAMPASMRSPGARTARLIRIGGSTMRIPITYCVVGNYLPRATSLAAEISRKLGVQPELIKGSNGVFDVAADGSLIFSQHSQGRHPD